MADGYAALIVDHSASARRYLAGILRDQLSVCDVLEADTPESALRMLQRDPGRPVRCVFTELEGAGMPAAEFGRALRAIPATARAPFLVVTGRDAPDAERVAFAIGAHGYLCKPFDAATLLDTLQRVAPEAERRRDTRVPSHLSCVLELSFADSHPFAADLLNISLSGCLARMELPPPGAVNIYGSSALHVRPELGDEVRLSARVMRLEADPADDSESWVRVALEFLPTDPAQHTALARYIELCTQMAVVCGLDR